MTSNVDFLAQTGCEWHTDLVSRQAYSVDASIYEVLPLAIAIPKDEAELIAVVKAAYAHKIPIIPRGAATGIAGGCLGKGIVIDLSKYFTSILEINIDAGYAIVEPGVIQDQLNQALAPFGYRLGPDTSTGNRATLGGMVANNSAGSHSLLYGSMFDHLLEVRMVLATGEIVILNQFCTDERINREIEDFKNKYKGVIQKQFPTLKRRVSGYSLNGLDYLAKLIAGSEGTLGIITEIKIALSKKLTHSTLALLTFNSVVETMKRVPDILAFKPSALELIDSQIIEGGRASPTMRGKLDWLEGHPEAILAAEFDGETQEASIEKAQLFIFEMRNRKIGDNQTLLLDHQKVQHFWQVRKAGLELLLSKQSYSRAIAFIEDFTLPPDKLGAFFEQFTNMLKAKGKEAGIYGHVGAGCIHVRPYMNLRDPQDVVLMQEMMETLCDQVRELGGVLSGEHGDGLIRSWLNPRLFGPEINQAFLDLKKIFDPDNLLNPGKIVNGPPLLENLRVDPNTPQVHLDTFFDFSKEGGFELAVDLCNGNGLCRKAEGLMCPSFQASNDEYDSTRARAQALRAVINGKSPYKDLTDPALLDVLDLCIQCKGCKTECPSQVDMAKMKSEVLYHNPSTSKRTKLFAHLPTVLHWGSLVPRLANNLIQTSWGKNMLARMGIDPAVPLPRLSLYRFSTWFKKNYKPSPGAHQVVLFNDSFTEHISPEIGIAAVKVLTALGYDVILPPWRCCGRTLISKGFLPNARDKALQVLNTFAPYSDRHLPIIGLEPSCILTLRDEFGSLNLPRQLENVFTFPEFMAEQLQNQHLPLILDLHPQDIKAHVHCHQKALVGVHPTLAVLKAIPGYNVEEIRTTCCGMAGSFGYETEHVSFSEKIANVALVPQLENTPLSTLITADGTSCRTQISRLTEHRPLHLAEILANILFKD